MMSQEEILTPTVSLNDTSLNDTELATVEVKPPPLTLTYEEYITERADLLFRLTHLPSYLNLKVLDYRIHQVTPTDAARLPEYFQDAVLNLDVHIRRYYPETTQPRLDYWYQFYITPDGTWKDYEDHVLATVLYEWSASVRQMKKDGQLH